VVETAGTLVTRPVGAGHGAPRAAAGRAAVWLGGRRCPVVEVALDRMLVDTAEVDAGGTAGMAVAPGAEAVLIGTGEHGEPTAAEWAAWAGTNPHEILTGFGNRVPRRYLPARPAALSEGPSE
jgi:alanine racemase